MRGHKAQALLVALLSSSRSRGIRSRPDEDLHVALLSSSIRPAIIFVLGHFALVALHSSTHREVDKDNCPLRSDGAVALLYSSRSVQELLCAW